MAEGARASGSGRLETDVTSTFRSCSMLSVFSDSACVVVSGCWLDAGGVKQTRLQATSIAVAAVTAFQSPIARCPPSWCFAPLEVHVLDQSRGDACHRAEIGQQCVASQGKNKGVFAAQAGGNAASPGLGGQRTSPGCSSEAQGSPNENSLGQGDLPSSRGRTRSCDPLTQNRPGRVLGNRKLGVWRLGNPDETPETGPNRTRPRRQRSVTA